MEKRPGFGRKRERLEARLPGEATGPPPRKVAIVGAGIAGASAARAVRALGGEAVVVEADRPGGGGSGNPAALVTPRLDAGLGEAARLYAQAFARAIASYAEVPDAIVTRGALQFPADDRDVDRFARIAASDVFEPGALTVLDAAATAARVGEAAPAALDQTTALVVAPAQILAAWIGAAVPGKVAALARDGDGWRLLDAADGEILRADAVIVAAALASPELVEIAPLQAIRGQTSWTTSGPAAPAAAWGGYVLPTRDGLLFGATHDRDDLSTEVRDADHLRNRAALAEGLPDMAARVADLPLHGRAAIRAAAPDRMPLAGALQDGLFVLTGFGSRGFSLAPLLAEHVAALALDAPSPLSRAAAELVAPDRFARRAARRRHS